MPRKPKDRTFSHPFKEQIYSFLEEEGISWQKLADYIGVQRSYLNKWVLNSQRNYTLDIVAGFQQFKREYIEKQGQEALDRNPLPPEEEEAYHEEQHLEDEEDILE